jgi:hypothetical protein
MPDIEDYNDEAFLIDLVMTAPLARGEHCRCRRDLRRASQQRALEWRMMLPGAAIDRPVDSSSRSGLIAADWCEGSITKKTP